jgi:hypothetical protein
VEILTIPVGKYQLPNYKELKRTQETNHEEQKKIRSKRRR